MLHRGLTYGSLFDRMNLFVTYLGKGFVVFITIYTVIEIVSPYDYNGFELPLLLVSVIYPKYLVD